MDFKLTGHDLDVTNGELSLVTGIEAVVQDITMTLRTFLEESVYDRSAGVPYLQIIFKKGTSLQTVRFILEQIILQVDGVTEVIDLDTSDFDRNTRSLVVTGTVRALDQEFPIEVEIGEATT